MGRTSDAKERLMAAALDLIWEESYGNVTIDDICKRADVRKGSFYYFFPGKVELAIAAIEDDWKNEMKPNLDGYFSSSVEPLERFKVYLAAIYTHQLELISKHGKVMGCPVCSLGTNAGSEEAPVSVVVRDILARKRRYYETTIRDAVAAGVIEPCDPQQKALALFGLIEGLVGQARIMNDASLLKSLPSLGLELLRAKEPAPSPAI